MALLPNTQLTGILPSVHSGGDPSESLSRLVPGTMQGLDHGQLGLPLYPHLRSITVQGVHGQS